MKFNWGTGIALFFTFFAASMVFAVVRSTYHKPQLMQQDYYALDLDYQARLEKKQHTAALAVLPGVSFVAGSNSIQVKFPAGMTAASGTAKCYRSVTTRDDFSIDISNATSLDIPAATLPTGRWHVELDWKTADGMPYFYETAIIITKN